MCIKKAICIASVGVMSSLCAMGNFPETDYEPGERAEIRKKNCEKEFISELNLDENDENTKQLLSHLTNLNEMLADPDYDELLQNIEFFRQDNIIEYAADDCASLLGKLDMLLDQSANFDGKICRISDKYLEIDDLDNAKRCCVPLEEICKKLRELFYLYKEKKNILHSPFLEKAVGIFKRHRYWGPSF